MIEIGAALQATSALAGAASVLKTTLEYFKPNLRSRFSNKIIKSNLVSYTVPANHHVTRVFRLAWCRAATHVLDRATEALTHKGASEFDHPQFKNIVESVKKRISSIIETAEDTSTENNLSRIDIDEQLEAVLFMLSDHMMRATEKNERERLLVAFKAWIVGGLEAGLKDEFPPIIMMTAKGQGEVNDITSRGFPYLLMDQFAHYFQNRDLYPDAVDSIQLAIKQLQHNAIQKTLSQMKWQESAADRRAIEEVLSDYIMPSLNSIEGKIDKIIDAVKIMIEEINAGNRQSATDTFEIVATPSKTTELFPSVLLALSGENTRWCDNVEQVVSSALDRLAPQEGFSFIPIDINKLNESPQSFWQKLAQSSDWIHGATLLLVSNTLGQRIPIATSLEDRLFKASYLFEGDVRQGVFNAEKYDVRERRGILEDGAVPSTAAVRLAFETLMNNRPLYIFDDSDEKERDIEVTNFFDWQRSLGTPVVKVKSEGRASVWASSLVRHVFDLTSAVIENPYFRLEHYMPEDLKHYQGRSKETLKVRQVLENSPKGLTEMLRIGGPSGVGKSSFMNARVAGEAAKLGYEYFTFRPTDITTQSGLPDTPIASFCELLSARFGWILAKHSHPMVIAPDPKTATAAAFSWLSDMLGEDNRLVLGVDQFEEIVDNIDNGWAGSKWQALVDLIAQISASPAMLVAFTLESSRERAFERVVQGTTFAKAVRIDLEDDQQFLRDVINLPFVDAGFRLDEETVQVLLDEAGKYGASAGETISALPLLTLKLYALFRYVADNFAPDTSKRPSAYSNVLTLVERKRIKMSLDIGEEIENLAWDAWNESGSKNDDLDSFLRPFIRVVPSADSDGGRMVLATVPARGFHSVADRQASFERRRLVVPAPGGHRLTHEAIMRRWVLAREWFEREREALRQETDFLSKAPSWSATGRTPIETATPEVISMAAKILRHRLSDWGGIEASLLGEADDAKRAYCLAHFELSNDPMTVVEGGTIQYRRIHVAAGYGLTELVERYIASDAKALDVPRGDDDKGTPLMTAGFMSAPVVRLLLEKGANPQTVDKEGWRAIDSAIWGKNDEAFDALLTVTDPEWAAEDPVSFNPLYSAASMKRLDLINRLEGRGWRHDRPTLGFGSPLIGACISGDEAVVRHCLSLGDPTQRFADGYNAFDFAAQMGHVNVLEILLGHEASKECLFGKSSEGWTSLMRAAVVLKNEAVTYLVNAGADVTAHITKGEKKNGTVLHCALDWLSRFDGRATRFVADRTRDTVAALLASEDLDVMASDDSGRSAWPMAQHHPSIQALIAAHSSFNLQGLPEDAKTPLDRLIEDDERDAIREFLSVETNRWLAGRSVGGSMPAEKMCGLGFGDQVLELVREGHVKPWSPTGGNLFGAAWRADHSALVAEIIRALPAKLSTRELQSVIMPALVAGPNGQRPADRPPDGEFVAKAIERAADEDVLNDVLKTVGQLGGVEIFERMVKAGANPECLDDWGRTILENSSDTVLKTRGNHTNGWPPGIGPAGIKWIALKDREVLRSGDIDAIRILLTGYGIGRRGDGWDRSPADLVPDSIAPLVTSMTSKTEMDK